MSEEQKENFLDKIDDLREEMNEVQKRYLRDEFNKALMCDNSLGRIDAMACIAVANKMGWHDLAYEMKADI